MVCQPLLDEVITDAVKGMSTEKLKVKYNAAGLIIKTTFWYVQRVNLHIHAQIYISINDHSIV